MKITPDHVANRRVRSNGHRAVIVPFVLFLLCISSARIIAAEGPRAAAASRANTSALNSSQRTQWQALIEHGRVISRTEMMSEVNRFFNRLTAMEDTRHWGRADYWATPAELLSSGAGDCEDFAIAKYFALRDMGVDDGDLRIMYVERRLGRTTKIEPHMVLGVLQSDGSLLILDNLTPDIMPLARRADLRPIYEFNRDTVWLWRDGREPIMLGASAQLTQWRDLLKRI